MKPVFFILLAWYVAYLAKGPVTNESEARASGICFLISAIIAVAGMICAIIEL